MNSSGYFCWFLFCSSCLLTEEEEEADVLRPPQDLLIHQGLPIDLPPHLLLIVLPIPDRPPPPQDLDTGHLHHHLPTVPPQDLPHLLDRNGPSGHHANSRVLRR